MSTNALFILSRVDMASMTPGRAIAQATHATSLFEKAAAKAQLPGDSFAEWSDEAGPWTFGTTYVYEGTLADLEHAISAASSTDDVTTGVVIDPEYYVRDGDIMHRLENVTTCAWLFGDVDTIKRMMRELGIKMHR